MISIWYKDILLQKRTLKFGALYILMMMFVFQERTGTMVQAGIVSLTYIMIQTSNVYDEKNDSDMLFNSLPIGRRRIVLAKYLSAFMFLFISTIYYLVISIIMKILPLNIKVDSQSLLTGIGAVIAVLLINTLYLPIYFKVGYAKAKVINILIFLGFFVLTLQLGDIVGSSELVIFQNIVSFLNRLTEIIFAIGTLVILCGLYFISYLISCRFYVNRQI